LVFLHGISSVIDAISHADYLNFIADPPYFPTKINRKQQQWSGMYSSKKTP